MSTNDIATLKSSAANERTRTAANEKARNLKLFTKEKSDLADRLAALKVQTDSLEDSQEIEYESRNVFNSILFYGSFPPFILIGGITNLRFYISFDEGIKYVVD